MSNEQNNSFIDQLGRGLGGLFKFIVRLVFVLVLAIALGAGLYYGIAYGLPALDRAYLEPVRSNTAAIADLESQAAQLSTQQAAQITAMQERVTALEVQNDTNLNSLDAVQAQLDALAPLTEQQAGLVARLDEMDTALQALDDTLATAQNTNVTRFTELGDSLASSQAAIDALTSELSASDFPIEQAYADLQLVKAMALLTRAQLFIFENNLGFAAQDIAQARDLLVAVNQDPALAGLDLGPVLTRLSLALSSLPLNPDLAGSDLAIAWDLLVAGISIAPEGQPAETPEETPTP